MTLKTPVFIKRNDYWLFSLILSLLLFAANTEAEAFAEKFMLQQKEGRSCLTLDVRDDEFSSCVYEDPEKAGLCYPRNRAVLTRCDEGNSSQRWFYDDQKKHLYYQGYSTAMCLSRMVETVEMLPCSDEITGQIWFFNGDRELVSAADREFPQAYLRLLGQDEFDPKPLTFQFVRSEMGNKECFKSPLTGAVECALPDDGSVDDKPENPDQEPTEPVEPDPGDKSGEDPDADNDGDKKDQPPETDNPPELGPGECYQNPETGVIICSEPEAPPAATVDWDSPHGLFWVSDKLTQDIELTYTVNTVCLEVQQPAACLKNRDYSRACYSGQTVVTATCLGQDQSLWKHDLKTKRIFNKAAGYGYCLTWLQNRLQLMPCFAGTSPAQKWFFGLGTYAAPLERGRLKTAINGGLKPFDYLKVLDLPLSYGSASGVRSERSVNYEPFGELCGFEPIEGKWTGDCAN